MAQCSANLLKLFMTASQAIDMAQSYCVINLISGSTNCSAAMSEVSCASATLECGCTVVIESGT